MTYSDFGAVFVDLQNCTLFKEEVDFPFSDTNQHKCHPSILLGNSKDNACVDLCH